jgi:hypothetical protein
VIIVDAKKHLPLDAWRIGNGSVKALVDPLDSEERFCWQAFEDAFENFGGVEDLLARFRGCQVELSLRSNSSLSILFGALALLCICC